jgi:FAD:protein FMN transferase
MNSKDWRLAAVVGAAATVIAPVTAQAAHELNVTAEAMQQPIWNFHHEQLLGTSVEISLRAANKADAQRVESAVLAALDRDEARLSAWKPESEFSRWHRTRFEPVEVSPELFAVLDGFDRWRQKTDGALDPSVEAATRLWKQAAAEGRYPSDHEIAEVREAIQQPHWSLDAKHRTATHLNDTPLALASFVKSWIVERAAEVALREGASGVTINAGGDVVTRGSMIQVVTIADPWSAADNAATFEAVVVHDRAVATSGGSRRGFQIEEAVAVQAPEFSHLIDPKTVMPVGHVLSSTVIAHDAETAGALATAFSVMPVKNAQQLAASLPGVEYMLVLADGSRVNSLGWNQLRFGGTLKPWIQRATLPVSKTLPGQWDPYFELAIELNLPRIDNARYRRPYVAVWIEDANHYPVRTLALWSESPLWLPNLKRWYHDDQIRAISERTNISRTVSSATRAPGKYGLIWDGKDNTGKFVKAGRYTVCIEVSREHGGYELQQREIQFVGKPTKEHINPGQEMGAVLLDYRKR